MKLNNLTKPLCVVPLLAIGASLGCSAQETTPIHASSVTVSSPTLRTWQGWGCALYWWANVFGSNETMCQVCFGKTTTVLNSQNLPNLRFNIVRYNLGGSGPGMVNSRTMPAFKAINGFWLSPRSSNPLSATFNWHADAAQVEALKTAKALGADHFEIASNSPMWWMCTNGSTTGSDNGGDNLMTRYYTDFAYSLALAAKHARTAWHVPVTAVEPFNEPSAWWWKFPGRQEGCHFDKSTQAKIIPLLRAELNHIGLADVKIAASDENSPPEALATWNSFSAAVRADIGRVNTHGYSGLSPYRGPAMAELRRAVGSMPLWMSEDGDGDATGMTMAQTIAANINQLGADAWCYWQPYDSGGWGLIQCNPGDHWVGTPNTKYYMMAQFSRHIMEHMQVLSTSDVDTVAAYDPIKHKLVAVIVNTGAPRTISLQLNGFTSTKPSGSEWTTTSNGSVLYAHAALANLHLPTLHVPVAGGSVATVEIDNVNRKSSAN